MLFFHVTNLHAQHFEWAASAGNVDIRYSYSSVDADNNIVVGGPGGVSWVHRGRPELYNASGESTELQYSERLDVVASYSPEGALLWHLQTDQRYMELKGIAHDIKGSTVLLVNLYNPNYLETLFRANWSDEPHDQFDLGQLSKAEGFYLLYLDKKGKFKHCNRMFDSEGSAHEISSFIAYPNGGFLLSGFANAGKLCEELPDVAGPGGGDFVMLLDADGKPLWVDVISYAKTTCCSYSGDMCKVSAAPDGTIYLTGTYFEGATFGKGTKVIKAATKARSPFENIEAYIASYSAAGKLNWVKSTACRAWSHSVAANNKGVVVAIKLGEGNRFLGEKIDTTGSRHWVLAMLDKSGNVKWKTSSSTDRAHDIHFDQDNNVYVLGTHREIGKWNNATGLIGPDTLQAKFTEVFIAKFSIDGKYQWVKEADIPVTTSNELLRFNMDHCGNMYVSGTLWFTFSAQLSMFDKAFVKGSIYGPAPFISRFKNTISRSLAKPAQQAETCILSPGPWKLRNYPNPFSSSTTFEYTLSYADKVTLQLFDMNGKLLQTLIQSKQHAAGKHTYRFSSPLSSGTYIAILQGTETTVTAKIMILR
jgi:hypothetical protein